MLCHLSRPKCAYHRLALVLVIFVVILVWNNGGVVYASSLDDSSAEVINGTVWQDFAHERCQKETLSSNQFKTFYNAKPFYFPDGVFEMLIRFKGIADGHVILTSNASSDEPRYSISFGSYNNRFSEIRRMKPNRVETKVSTPSIMSDLQFRGFIIRYDPNQGHLSVFGEGSDVALLHVEDTNEPLTVNYFSFATWHNRIVHVAFHCIPKDSHSTADLRSFGCQAETVSGYYTEISHFYKVDPFVGENGVLELLVRFKGPSDGHVALTPFANSSDPAYIVIMGSYENKLSEIRRAIDTSPVFKINTPGILSTIQYRGFLVKYNEKRGELWVFSEGSYMPLLHWIDPNPLTVHYFSFAAYDDVVVEVAFNCKPRDLHSLIFQHKSGLTITNIVL